MPLPQKKIYTSDDYRNLPDGYRAELIDGQFYDLATPGRLHQHISYQLSQAIGSYIAANKGGCLVYPAPFSVNLDADDKNWVEPDISVIYDRSKLTDHGCSGAPDLIVEVVSPSSRKMDYSTKNYLYSNSGVREYWIVDPEKNFTTVYYLEQDSAPTIIPFANAIHSNIFPGLAVCIQDLLKDY